MTRVDASWGNMRNALRQNRIGGRRDREKLERDLDRRAFLRAGVRGAGLVGLGGAVGFAASRYLPYSVRETAVGGGAPSLDLDKYATVDPALMQYTEIGKIQTGFRSMRGIAVDPENRILVAGDRSIKVFGEDAEFLRQIELGAAPRCLPVSEEGVLYVGLKDRVEVYDQSGTQQARWHDLGANAVLTSIAVSGDDVFLANAGQREILRYTRSAKQVLHFGKKDPSRNMPGFVVPSPYFDLAIGQDGLLKVANPGRHRMEAYTLEGDFELSWGEASMGIEGFCGCCNPVNFALLPDGRIVTSEKGLPRIKVYEANGSFSGVVAAPRDFEANQQACCGSAEASEPTGDVSNCQSGGIDLATDARGRVLALDPVEQVVRIFEPLTGT